MNNLSTISSQNLDIIGLDLGDKHSNWALMTQACEDVLEEGRVRTREDALRRKFQTMPPARVVMEVGTHSPWVSRLIAECGHEVILANPRKLKMIFANHKKSDKVDAQLLARVGRLDTQLLAPIRHRRADTQADLARLRARDALVQARTGLINNARGLAKAQGHRLPACGSACFHRKAAENLPESLAPALTGVLLSVGALTAQIEAYDKDIEVLCRDKHDDAMLLREIAGVGPITALAFILTIESPEHFEKNRDVGAYLGLTPRQDQSGDSNPQLGISKTGDPFLRRTLVQAAHYIIGNRNTQDSELRQWGLKIAGPIGPQGKHDKTRKRKAVTAVARKLAVLLLTLWRNGECYAPFHQQTQRQDREHAA